MRAWCTRPPSPQKPWCAIPKTEAASMINPQNAHRKGSEVMGFQAWKLTFHEILWQWKCLLTSKGSSNLLPMKRWSRIATACWHLLLGTNVSWLWPWSLAAKDPHGTQQEWFLRTWKHCSKRAGNGKLSAMRQWCSFQSYLPLQLLWKPR